MSIFGSGRLFWSLTVVGAATSAVFGVAAPAVVPQMALGSEIKLGSELALGQQTQPVVLSEAHTRARQLYEQQWESANQPLAFSQNAVLSTCTPGSASSSAVAASLRAINYARSLNSLEPLSVPENYGATGPAQAAALSAAASKSASNFPTTEGGFACVSPDATLGASSGLIARSASIAAPATEMLRYFTEASATDANDSLGHRLQLLNPQLANIAVGLVSTGTTGPSASSLQTFDSNYVKSGIKLQPPMNDPQRVGPAYLTWPAQGFFPTTMLPTGATETVSRWSFSAKCADLRSARVSVTGPDGPLPVQVVHRDQPGVEKAKTPWSFAGYDTVLIKVPTSAISQPQFYNTTDYRVQVDNILPASPSCQPPAASYSYQVSLFDPRWPSNPQGDFDQDGIANYADSQPRIPDLRVDRIAGIDRIETAVNIAKYAFPKGSEVVYLARSDIFADALSGGVFKDGPVLLLPKDQVPAAVKDVIKQLSAKQVIALGGPKAISNEQLREAANYQRPTARVYGMDRYGTSVLIARRAFTAAQTLYLAASDPASPQSGADAVSASSLSDGPIALVSPSGANLMELRQLARDLGVKRVVALGGAKVLPAPFVREVAQSLPAARLAGADRYETSRLITAEAVRIKPTTKVYLSRGDLLVDALTGGCLGDGPVLLVRPDSTLDTNILQMLAVARSYQTIALGGKKAIPERQLQQAVLWPYIEQSLPEGF